MTPEDNFRAIVPAYMDKLIADFPTLNKLDAAAVFGNAGHESLGLTVLQQMGLNPPNGGWGWFQWSGSRRQQFEAYVQRAGLDPSAPETNYKFLFVELKGSEEHALGAVHAAVSLDDKVIAFEEAYERAGVKAYPSRQRWANIALDAYETADAYKKAHASTPAPVPPAPIPAPVPKPLPPTPTPATPPAPAPAGPWWLSLIVSLIKYLFARKS